MDDKDADKLLGIWKIEDKLFLGKIRVVVNEKIQIGNS